MVDEDQALVGSNCKIPGQHCVLQRNCLKNEACNITCQSYTNKWPGILQFDLSTGQIAIELNGAYPFDSDSSGAARFSSLNNPIQLGLCALKGMCQEIRPNSATTTNCHQLKRNVKIIT